MIINNTKFNKKKTFILNREIEKIDTIVKIFKFHITFIFNFKNCI